MRQVSVFWILVFLAGLASSVVDGEGMKTDSSSRNLLEIHSTKTFGQIEVGGPYVGVEFHKGAVLPNRISFFYPLANTIDSLGDYWHRDQSRNAFLALKVGDHPWELVSTASEYRLTPFSVTFLTRDKEKEIAVSYRFCLSKPAMVLKIEVTNLQKVEIPFELFSYLKASLRTSSTYTSKGKAWSQFQSEGATVFVNSEDPETGRAQLFVANASERPQSFSTSEKHIRIPNISKHWSDDEHFTLSGELIDKSDLKTPVVSYLFKKNLAPQEKMTVIQIIGTCRQGEGPELIHELLENHETETTRYENTIRKKAMDPMPLETGDQGLDQSVLWAKAVLAVNAHYLDGNIVPMPCPAEYNFFFSHDTLLTDLAAVFFDLERVKKDLEFIASHVTGEGIIPHAYFWKDNRYFTEPVEVDSWNNQWFVMVAARYFRHSHDRKTLESLYPKLKKCVQRLLTNKNKDGLIWAYRPDWWDIGKRFGPRSYMTILGIRALKEFLYVATVLGKDSAEILPFETCASAMQAALTRTLWDSQLRYLVNYFEDGKKDSHLYIGSLLAPHFHLLGHTREKELVQTAKASLLDPKLGIYNVFPMDFHALDAFFSFQPKEAGDQFYYVNGGIWSHGNAWYALALMATGDKEGALKFMKTIMTIEGVMKSPCGQPAMYEYRSGDPRDPKYYGFIDKPQFLWAAGWYLYCCYNLLGARENEWNLSLDPFKIAVSRDEKFRFIAGGKPLQVTIKGEGRFIRSLSYCGKKYPSAVLPIELPGDELEVTLGVPSMPYLAHADSLLQAARWSEKKKTLSITLEAFKGHQSEISVISPFKPKSVKKIGFKIQAFIEKLGSSTSSAEKDAIYQIHFSIVHRTKIETIIVGF